jgi:hypothetical protein
MYMSMFASLCNPLMIITLRVISELLGMYRIYPTCLACKMVLDIAIREPINMMLISGVNSK